MKKAISKLWSDIVSETPKVYKWVSGILTSVGASMAVVASTYGNLPSSIQVLPQSVLSTIAVVTLLGAALAKKQNIPTV